MLGILPIRVETSIFNNMAREDRKCEICDSGEDENECHFLFQCERYIIMMLV